MREREGGRKNQGAKRKEEIPCSFFFYPEGMCLQVECRFPARLFLSPCREEGKKAGRSKREGVEERNLSACHFAIPFSESWLGVRVVAVFKNN